MLSKKILLYTVKHVNNYVYGDRICNDSIYQT